MTTIANPEGTTIADANAPSQEEIELVRSEDSEGGQSDEAAVALIDGDGDASETTEEKKEKPKLELKRVDAPPSLPLKVNMARQASEYFTGPTWPEFSSLTKPFNYVLQPDGLWEIRNVQAGWLVRQREKFAKKLPGFIEESRTNFGIPRYGKIPSDLYWQIVSFFKDICNDSGDEVYVQTFWDPANNTYFNHVPKQIVSGASVRYERDQELEDRCPLVVETHSHNKMGAFFSGIDNADEKSDRFFGVMGKLNTHNPEVLYSFLCGGVRTNIPVGDIFDLGHPDTFPEAWKDQVTRQATTVSRSWSNGGVGSGGYQGYQGSQRGSGYSYGGSKRPSQGALWRGSSTKAQEAKKQIEAEAEKAEKEVDEEWSVDDFLSQVDSEESEGLTHRPFFRRSLKSSSDEDEKLNNAITDIILELSDTDRSDAMSEEEKEQLFQNLVEVLCDDDVAILSGVLVEHGFGEFLLTALDDGTEDGFEDDDSEEEIEEAEESDD